MPINYFPDDEVRCSKCNAIAAPGEICCAVCNTSLEQSPKNKSKTPKSEGIEAVFSQLNFECPNCGNVETLGANICSSCDHSLNRPSENKKSKVISIVNRISHQKPKDRGKQRQRQETNERKSVNKTRNRQPSPRSKDSTRSPSSVSQKIGDYVSFNKKMLLSCSISTILAGSILVGLNRKNSLDNPNLSSGDVNMETRTLSYGGSLCLVSLFRQDIEPAIEARHSQYNFEYISSSSREDACSLDIKPLLDEEVDFIVSNRHVAITERFVAEKRGIELGSSPFAVEGLLPVINPNQNLGHLSISQLRAIFAKKLTNWNQIGGANLTITPVILEGTENADLDLLMVGSDYTPSEDVIVVPDYTSGIQKVATTPGAIFLAPLSVVQNQEKVTPVAVSPQNDSAPVAALLGDRSINLEAFTQHQYPLRRSLFLIYSERVASTVRPEAAIYLDFLASKEGRQLLEKNGLIPSFLAN